MIPAIEAGRAISFRRNAALVVATGHALRVWAAISTTRKLDVDMTDCADKASSVALGLALSQPHRPVLVLDCPTSLKSNLGSLATIASAAPANLVHFLFNDPHNTAGEPIPRGWLEPIDLYALARSAGYRHCYSFDNLEDLTVTLDQVLEWPGPTFLSLRVSYGKGLPPDPTRSMAPSMTELRQELAASNHLLSAYPST